MLLPSTSSRSKTRRGFTLIELLVVIAIIAILAAILFPVFAQVRERARATACLSNEKQLGLAVQQYLQDYDERLFFYADTTSAADSRSNVLAPTPSNTIKWWNVTMPYIKSNGVFTCPSDPTPTPSVDMNNVKTIPRSYIACRSAESLTLAQIDDPVETVVFVDKWEKDSAGPVTDTWIEAFNGDFDPDYGAGGDQTHMFKAGNRHQGRINCVMFDGHAKAYSAAALQNSKDLTGCTLIYQYPVTGPSGMTTGGASSAAGEPNICANFTYP